MAPKIAKRKMEIKANRHTTRMKLLIAQCHRRLNMKKNRVTKEEAQANTS
jgi:hypothetical protein